MLVLHSCYSCCIFTEQTFTAVSKLLLNFSDMRNQIKSFVRFVIEKYFMLSDVQQRYHKIIKHTQFYTKGVDYVPYCGTEGHSNMACILKLTSFWLLGNMTKHF